MEKKNCTLIVLKSQNTIMFGIGLVCSHHKYEEDNLICPVFLTSAHENSLSMLMWASAKEYRRLISNKEERTVSTRNQKQRINVGSSQL